MARQRDLLVNFERMRREVDELVGDVWGEAGRWLRPQSGFSPRVDVYYCGEPPKAIVKVDLAGVSLDSVGLEVSGRRLTISGERPLQETEGRVYQQIEIQSGPFRRVVELSADVVAQAARATYEDGVLRVELPLRTLEADTTRVPIETGD
jgi:HSP20 family protein